MADRTVFGGVDVTQLEILAAVAAWAGAVQVRAKRRRLAGRVQGEPSQLRDDSGPRGRACGLLLPQSAALADRAAVDTGRASHGKRRTDPAAVREDTFTVLLGFRMRCCAPLPADTWCQLASGRGS